MNLFNAKIIENYLKELSDCGGGVVVERSPRVREVGIRNPTASDLSRYALLINSR